MIKALLALAASITLVWMLDTKHGDLPPFGKLLSPYRGFWQNGEGPATFLNARRWPCPACASP